MSGNASTSIFFLIEKYEYNILPMNFFQVYLNMKVNNKYPILFVNV